MFNFYCLFLSGWQRAVWSSLGVRTTCLRAERQHLSSILEVKIRILGSMASEHCLPLTTDMVMSLANNWDSPLTGWLKTCLVGQPQILWGKIRDQVFGSADKRVIATRQEMPGKSGETRHPGAGRIILEWGPWPRGSLKSVKYISGAMMDCSPEQALSKIYIMGISHSSFSYSDHGYCNASRHRSQQLS